MLMYKNEVRINYGCWDVNDVGTDANNKRKRIMKGKNEVDTRNEWPCGTVRRIFQSSKHKFK